MGLQALYKGKLSKIRRNNTTNPRVAREFTRRVTDIASDLDRTRDEEKTALLETIVAEVSDSFQPPTKDGLTQRLEPLLFAKRQEALIMADEKLNSIKPPAPERKETIEAAAMHDYESLEKETKGLLEISVDNLQSLLELLPASTDVNSQTLANLRQEQPKIVNLQALILDVADKIKVLQKDGTIDKQFMIKVIRLDEPTQAAKHQPIHPDLTFGDLCQDLDKPEENALPEIWLKKVDPKQNCVTKSGIWWEQQDPADSIRAVLEDRGMDREVVDFGIVWCNEDYVIVLIQDNGEETGRSFKFSDGKPQRISERFKNEFQDRQVCKILRLKDGSDASNKMFDRSFLKAKTNPLYLELTPVTIPTTRATV